MRCQKKNCECTLRRVVEEGIESAFFDHSEVWIHAGVATLDPKKPLAHNSGAAQKESGLSVVHVK